MSCEQSRGILEQGETHGHHPNKSSSCPHNFAVRKALTICNPEAVRFLIVGALLL